MYQLTKIWVNLPGTDDDFVPVIPKGCWKDNATARTMVNIDGDIQKRFGANYISRTEPKIHCMRVAIKRGFVVYALQNGGECWGSPTLDSYKKYGEAPKGKCKDGKGGPSANDVYELPPGKK